MTVSANKTSKLGKNPFEKKVKSQVGRMIEASFSSATEPVKSIPNRSLIERFQEMKISVDIREIFKLTKERSK